MWGNTRPHSLIYSQVVVLGASHSKTGAELLGASLRREAGNHVFSGYLGLLVRKVQSLAPDLQIGPGGAQCCALQGEREAAQEHIEKLCSLLCFGEMVALPPIICRFGRQ